MTELQPHDAVPTKRGAPGRRAYGFLVLAIFGPAALLAVMSATGKRPDNLGVVDGQLADCPPSPNCVCTQATDAAHLMEPISFAGTADEASQRLRGILQTIPRTKIVTDGGDYIHAEVASLVFRFVDDVEFYIDADAKLIHCRSASRVGRSDFGVNLARVDSIRAAFTVAED